jgi:hypothetical protein
MSTPSSNETAPRRSYGIIASLTVERRLLLAERLEMFLSRGIAPTTLVNAVEKPALMTLSTMHSAIARVREFRDQMPGIIDALHDESLDTMGYGIPLVSYRQLRTYTNKNGIVRRGTILKQSREYDVNVVAGLAVAKFSDIPVVVRSDRFLDFDGQERFGMGVMCRPHGAVVHDYATLARFAVPDGQVVSINPGIQAA